MRRPFLIALALALLAGSAFSFPYSTSTGTFPVASSSPSDWSAFRWNWSGRDYRMINVAFTGLTDPSTISNVYLRLAYPEKGPYFLSINTGALTPSGSTLSWSTPSALAPTNIPPDRTYYAEFLGVASDGSSRTLAKGKITIDWSLYSITNSTSWVPVNVVYAGSGTVTLVETDPIFIAVSNTYWSAITWGSNRVMSLEAQVASNLAAQAASNVAFQAALDAQAGTNVVFELRISSNETFRLVSQLATNTAFQALFDAQAATNAAFQNLHTAQADTNSLFQGFLVSQQATNLIFQGYYASQTSTNDLLRASITSLQTNQAATNTVFRNLFLGQVVTNATFQGILTSLLATNALVQGVLDSLTTNQAATNALFQARFDGLVYSNLDITAVLAAQANTNAGFQAALTAQLGTNILLREGTETVRTNQEATNVVFQSRFNSQTATNSYFQGLHTSQANSNAGFQADIVTLRTNQAATNALFQAALGAIGTNAPEPLWIANSNAVISNSTLGQTAYSWGNHASAGYLRSGTNVFSSLDVLNRAELGANVCDLTNAVYTGAVSSVSYTGAMYVIPGRAYLYGFDKTTSYGTGTLTVGTNVVSATASGSVSNLFWAETYVTNVLLTLAGDGVSLCNATNVYVKQITNGLLRSAGPVVFGGPVTVAGNTLDLRGTTESRVRHSVSAAGAAVKSQTRTAGNILDPDLVHPWTSATNTVVKDGLYGYGNSTNYGGISSYLRHYNYGFTLPANSIVVGVMLTYVMGDNAIVNLSFHGRLTTGSTVLTNTSVINNYTTNTLGGLGNLWGLSVLSPAQVNHSSFGADIATTAFSPLTSYQPRIDGVSLTVYYSDSTESYSAGVSTNGYTIDGPEGQQIAQVRTNEVRIYKPMWVCTNEATGEGAWIGDLGSGSTITLAVNPTWDEGTSNNVYVTGGTNLHVTFKTNYNGAAGVTSHTNLTDLQGSLTAQHVAAARTTVWDQAATDATTATSAIPRIAAMEVRTSTWNQAATDASTATNAMAITRDPSGWVGDTDNIGVMGVDSNRVFTITNATAMTAYRRGLVLTNSTSISFPAIGTNRGNWYIKWDATSGVQSASQTPWDLSDIQVASVYWSGLSNGTALIYEETHGLMPWSVHKRFHLDPKLSSAYVSGLAIVATNTSFSMASGSWMDEDIQHTISATTTNCIVANRDGVTGFMSYVGPRQQWYKTNAATGALQWDNAGSLQDVSAVGSANYMSMWAYVTPCTTSPVMWVVGRSSDTLANIQAESPPDISTLAPTAECILLYRVILRGTTASYIESTDYRLASVKGAASGTQAHATLSGRDAADQHPIAAISGLAEWTNTVSTGKLDVAATNGWTVSSHSGLATGAPIYAVTISGGSATGATTNGGRVDLTVGTNWLADPFQSYATVTPDAGGTCTVTYAHGGLVQVYQPAKNITISFTTSGYSTSGVSRVAVMVYSLTNSISLDYATCTNDFSTAATKSTNGWTRWMFMRTGNEIFKGRQ